MQLNYLVDHGAFRVDAAGTFSVDIAHVKQGVASLAHDLLTLQAEGSRAKAEEMLGKLAVVRPDVEHVFDKTRDVPVDIEPHYVTAEKILAVAH